MRFIQEISGTPKERSHLEKFVADERLIQHFLFFEQILPSNEMLVDELTAEGDRVICRARIRGTQGGSAGKLVDFPMAFGCEIERGRIVNHWMIADQAGLLEQLGIEKETIN